MRGRCTCADASECPPTFGVSPETVVGVIAGGKGAMFKSSENTEDIGESGVNDLKDINLCVNDIVMGISAAGGAGYVIKALEYAEQNGTNLHLMGLCSDGGIHSKLSHMYAIFSSISAIKSLPLVIGLSLPSVIT